MANNIVTLEFKELSYQSISARNGVRFHFEFFATLSPSRDKLLLTPLRDLYVFTDPIKDVHGLTAIFRGPDIPLVMSDDCLYGALAFVAVGQQLEFVYAGHELGINDRIVISGFTSSDEIINRYVNRPEGHLVGFNGYTPDRFRINPDVGTTILGLAVGAQISASKRITIYVTRNRIRIPLRIRGVLQRLTNYIAP